MKFLIIGLGSMGKRRVRNLKALGIANENINVFDLKQDRVNFAVEKYGVRGVSAVDDALLKKIDIIIVSTPPDQHHEYAKIALHNNKHCFIEASVIDFNHNELDKLAKKNNLTLFPSCTMMFYPAPVRIKEIILSGLIGKVCSWQYQSGQYLPDWHPWESINDFYVSNKETGGCREIVPFELVWILDMFGKVDSISCIKGKNSDIEANIDDIYALNIRHVNSGVIGQLMVDVISRAPIRTFRATGTKGTIEWNDSTNSINIFTHDSGEWKMEHVAVGNAEQGYINPEEPYILEMREFISKASLGAQPKFSMEDDAYILDALVKAEQS